jgi:virulence factor Mce-like protein
MRGRQQSAFANPVLVGAVTVLATMVAVFLAYNANQGLPFVPTRQLKVQIADGSNLVAGNDVREGGFRIGVLSKLKPVELPTGQVGAELTLQLDQSNGKVPVDSRVTILPRSVLGLKYVDVLKGTSTRVFPDGGTLPISQTTVPVQFDDIFKAFDTKTRSAIQKDLAGFGDTLTGRGGDLNDTIHSLPALLGHLEPVARYLSDPSTQLIRFFNSLNSFMGAVAPVAQTNAQLFTDMATTFEAISRDPVALEQTIAKSPPTLDVSTDSLRVQQPFLVDLTTLGGNLGPASAELKAALPDINPALEVGARTLKRTPSLNADLQHVMGALKSLALAPGTNVALRALDATVSTLNPMIRYLGPYVTVCNSWNYWWTFLGEHISEATTFGTAQRVLLMFANHQPDNFGSAGAAQPANGYAPLPDLPDAEYLHNPSYGAAIDTAGNADCESGQRGYVHKLNYGDPRGRNLEMDQHNPGNQGPTYTGSLHVPKGETFSRNPLFGPQTPRNPTNP